MAKVWDCGLEVSEFDLQFRYYVHFWTDAIGKDIDLPYLPAMGLIVSLLFYKDRFFIKWPTKVDMPLNQTKPNQTYVYMKMYVYIYT